MNEDKSDKGEYMRLIRERVSLNNELISVTSGMINSNEYKKAKKATATAKVKKTSTTKGTLKKKKLVVSDEAEEISP